MKIIILIVLLGLVMYALIIGTATPTDGDEFKQYEEWKAKKKSERGE